MLVLRIIEDGMIRRGFTGELSMTLENNYMINRFLAAIGANDTRPTGSTGAVWKIFDRAWTRVLSPVAARDDQGLPRRHSGG